MRAKPPGSGQGRASSRSDVARAGRGFVLVFAGALMFFGFVVGSELLGSIGQSVLAFVFASGALLWLWFRLDDETRQRVTRYARHPVRSSSQG